MWKKFADNCIKGLSGFAVLATLHSYSLSARDRNLRDNIEILNTEIKDLKTKLTGSTIDDVKTDLFATKLKAAEAKLDMLIKNAQHQVDKLSAIDPNSLGADTDTKNHVVELINQAREGGKTINEIIDLVSKRNNFISDSSFINTFKKLLEDWNNFISSLSIEQLGALAHFLATFLVLWCVFSIAIIVYSDILIKYFKLEEKYPKIAKFIKIRRMFQQFYLFFNFSLIIIISLAVIYVDCIVLFRI
jgi:hypothetical protein